MDNQIAVPGDGGRYASSCTMVPSLPTSIAYLEPFLRRLRTLPPEALNEDVVPDDLDEALRERFSGSDPAATLASDMSELQEWVDSAHPDDGPAHWLLGYLLGLNVEALFRPHGQSLSDAQRVVIDLPSGWSPRNPQNDYETVYVKRNLQASPSAIPASEFRMMCHQLDEPIASPPTLKATRTGEPLSSGRVSGRKYVYLQTQPVPWKEVMYLLRLPSAHVLATLSANGDEFDETDFENAVGSLRIQ